MGVQIPQWKGTILRGEGSAHFTVRRIYASAVLGVVILSVLPSVRLSDISIRLLHACLVTNPKNLPAIFLYHLKGQSF